MTEPNAFSFRRARGIIWVCDIVDSSKLLNDNETVASIEIFLPRLHWVAMIIVQAAGGEFIKWTGDGFLAWFEIPLHRELPLRVAAVLRAVWDITMLTNVTLLGVEAKRKIRLSHGITYEQDALISTITDQSGEHRQDLIGRSVVLAFRLAGVPASGLRIATQKEIAQAKSVTRSLATFTAWKPTHDECLKYFKGERWGTKTLYRSTPYKSRPASIQTLTRRLKNIVAKAELGPSGDHTSNDAVGQFIHEFVMGLANGPDWAQEVLKRYYRFLKDEFLEPAKKMLEWVEERKFKDMQADPTQSPFKEIDEALDLMDRK